MIMLPTPLELDRNRRNTYRIYTMKEGVVEEERCTTGGKQPGPDGQPDESSASDRELAVLAKALGHPARVQIVRFLLSRDSCMCGDIVEHLPLAQSTVSQHLKMLKESGLIRGTIDGPRVCYCVEPKVLERFKRLVSEL
jgi:ArsR family transcriptional regulator, arsenate/arsenite/antimonite-responsive transcriptional repressor